MNNQQTALTPLVIWGASGHARVVADIIRLTKNFEIVGFIDDVNPDRQASEFCGAKILGGQETLAQLRRAGVQHLIVGIGDCQARLRLSAIAQSLGFELTIAVHPKAIVAQDVTIGAGTVVAAGAVINPATKIGENVIVNTSASVDHDCRIEQGVHIGPGAHIGGGVSVGKASWVGIGVTIKDKIKIGRSTIIGAGAVVLTDIPDGVIAFGVPAKVQRNLEA